MTSIIDDSSWTALSGELPKVKGVRVDVNYKSRPATFAEVIHAWQYDTRFRSWFNSLLSHAPYEAFRWETPAVSASNISRPFECVLLDSPGLKVPADSQAFAKQFIAKDENVVTFPNLGGDAILAVPCPIADQSAYSHLAAFVRNAPESQRQALWKAVGVAMQGRIGKKPVWLSTAGAGVSWLHVRLDDRPKYYGFASYRSIS
jgi:hypothetical protein